MDNIIVDGFYPNYASYSDVLDFRRILASAIACNAVTDVIYVSPNGNGYDGKTWSTAFTTLQEALSEASTDGDDCTLILISPHTTYYDIDTTGYPTWTGNYILQGSYRNWAKIQNDHATASCIMKFSGKVALSSLNFNLGSGSADGIHMTHGGIYVDKCMFVGTNLTGAATGLYVVGSSQLKHCRINHCHFDGHTTHMTGFKAEKIAHSVFCDNKIHECLTGIHILDTDSDHNTFCNLDVGDCTTGIYIQAGNTQHLKNITFHDCTTNINDVVGDHVMTNLHGQFNMDTEPNNLTGVTVTANAVADTWGADTEIRAAATSTKPFRIIGYFVVPAVSQLHKVRFSADGGSTYFDEIIVTANKQEGEVSPAGTEYIFNKGTQIVASAKAETGGSDTLQVWLKIQEI